MPQRRSPSPGISPARPPRGRGRARGFTVPELLAVVVIIGIFAAAASPSFIRLMRDRRVNRAAMEITGLYRLARTRAMGRGTAVMVRWDGAAQVFEVREAVSIDPAHPISSNCASNDWNDIARFRQLYRIQFGTAPYELANVTFQNESGFAQPSTDICFTPRGRSFVRNATAGPFNAMTGVPRVTVQNAETNLNRTVLIPPNGIARMAL